MTHHTDAERAEFELMRFAFESKGSEAYKAWLIEVRDGDSYKPWDVVNDWRSWQTAWQAARRAPAVPQEPTSKQVVLGAGALLGQPEHTADNRHPEWHSAVEKVRKVYLAMLAAAPQPPDGLKRENPATKPEAAPVQLPEPVAKVESGSLKWHIPSAGYSLPVRYLQGNHMLYTEQQVRQLLVNHGIKERST